ncbi:PQQ-dependent sugar dehydrogenase [Nocardioides daphniae]|uniref:Oxidoreductase n=1 Tax=Nocardioides daphniae TaxID=402297 RepID=A0A4V1CWD1_9ACTN|nr:PQQ-dependent sugar dehydrogenase [Nocardioides daphniae]QCC76847.1 PQQ-dependent sugar dehydrogenase [Nocardioides daphniae]GGD17064.1 oxidoreductase [Nocardioides daphniae]
MRSSRRRLSAVVAVGLVAPLLAACGDTEGDGPDGVQTPTVQESASPTPSPTASPDGSTSAGEPRVRGAVAEGLRVPWGVTFLADGSALVTERDSWKVLHLTPDEGQGKDRSWSTTDLGVVRTDPGQGPSVEGGLLGIASLAEAGVERVFVYVTTGEDNRVLTATFDGDRLGPWKPVLTGIPRADYHDGGRIAFGPDGYLYVSTGDAGEPELAQDETSLAGKILRITAEGRPAPDNPFGRSPVYSIGHRNVQGLAWDDQGQLYASEFGADSFDELNRIEAGANYGWPQVEGMARGGEGRGLTDPVAVWSTDEASPSGLAWADGSFWLGALRGQRLWQVTVDGDEVDSTAHFVGEYGRMRTVVAAEDGLWVTTSNHDGRGDPAPDDDRILRVRR